MCDVCGYGFSHMEGCPSMLATQDADEYFCDSGAEASLYVARAEAVFT